MSKKKQLSQSLEKTNIEKILKSCCSKRQIYKCFVKEINEHLFTIKKKFNKYNVHLLVKKK